MSRGSKGTTPPPAPLPRQLHKLVEEVKPLEGSDAERLIASRRSGATVSRESLAALYALAARLHSSRLPFKSKVIETSAAKHVTTEQLWGQMNVLLRPVLRRLHDGVRQAERQYGDARPKAKQSKQPAADPIRGGAAARGAPAVAGNAGGRAAATAARDPAAAEELSDLSEDDLDEAIAGLLREQRRRREAASAKHQPKDGADDAWRYAFGKGNEEGDEDEEDGDEEDGEADLPDASRHDVRDRNARAMRSAALQDEGDDDEDTAAKAEEELAALRELYGEDFEDDGEGFLNDGEEDVNMAEDIELDDPAREADADAAPDDLYDERDGQFAGRADILNDEAGVFNDDDDGGAHDDGTRAAPADGQGDNEVDAELARALRNPNLTPLERERLQERALVERLEQSRLYNTDWAMAGETAANKRPREALLDEENLAFEYGMKAVPVITEASTAKLEERVKQRILSQQFDDVRRKSAISTAADLVTQKYDPALDAEKSKLSLMDLYERDYLAKLRRAEDATGEAPTAEPLTEIEKDELRAMQMWRRLAQHLDALSNFAFTPKPVQEELEARVRAVEHQAPAIAVETVGNFATTRADALAPQDLYRGSSHKFADVGMDELSPHERHLLRRHKKEEGRKHKEAVKVHQQRATKRREERQAERA